MPVGYPSLCSIFSQAATHRFHSALSDMLSNSRTASAIHGGQLDLLGYSTWSSAGSDGWWILVLALPSESVTLVPRGDGLSGLEDVWLSPLGLRGSILLVSHLDETEENSILTLLYQPSMNGVGFHSKKVLWFLVCVVWVRDWNMIASQHL